MCRRSSIEDKRYKAHSFLVEGAASHSMDGRAMDVVMEYVGWRSATVARQIRRGNSVHRGGRRGGEAFSRGQRSKRRRFCRCLSSLHIHMQRCHWTIEVGLTTSRSQGRGLRAVRATSNLRERQISHGIGRRAKEQQIWVLYHAEAQRPR